MAKQKRWVDNSVEHGFFEIELTSWKYFAELMNEHLRVFAKDTIWRGQASAKWKLESTLDRLLRGIGQIDDPDVRNRHLESFQRASRGRRGSNPELLPSENDWWALGQHFGLATPLLDWTSSPYVALYFAFSPIENDGDENRAVWALHRFNARYTSERELVDKPGLKEPQLQFVEPLSDSNSRLVSQGGLFTRGPNGIPLDDWARQAVPADLTGGLLMKITVPTIGREDCLRSLNRMNINHASLFPDLEGASRHCNTDLLIEDYC